MTCCTLSMKMPLLFCIASYLIHSRRQRTTIATHTSRTKWVCLNLRHGTQAKLAAVNELGTAGFNYMSLFELPKRRTMPGAAAAGGGAAPMMGMFGMQQQQPQQQAGGHVHSAACNHGPVPSAAPVAGAGAAGVGSQLAMSRFGIGSSAVGAGGEHAHAHTSMGK